MDYYSILDISSSASDIDIKKAYHKQALIWHPDKNDNSKESIDKFQMISEAYQILSNKKKRDEYDLYGTYSTNLKSPVDLFSELFNNIDPVIYSFLKQSFSHISDLSEINCTNVWDIFKKIDRDKLIENSGDIVKHILKKSISKTSPTHIDTTNMHICNLKLNVDEIHEYNTINLTIDCVRSVTHIKLCIYKEGVENYYVLDTNYDEHTIHFSNNQYVFLLEDSFPEGYERHNTDDIILRYDINYRYKSTGYRLQYEYETNNKLDINLDLNNNSNIVKIPGKGILNSNTTTHGNLYIILNYTYDDTTDVSENLNLPKDLPLYHTIDPLILVG